MYANMYNFEQDMRGTPSDRQASARRSRRVVLARLAGRPATRSSRSFTRPLVFSGR